MAIATDALRADAQARILDAAFRAVATFGLSRFTMEDVAREARVSRQTLYRYFASKDALVQALVYREEETVLRAVREAYHADVPLEEAMEQATLLCLRAAREHPLLDRLLASEPEVLLPYLTTRGGGFLERARRVLEELFAGRRDVRPEVAGRAADLAVRAIVSYALTPAEEPPETVARELAEILARAVRTPTRRRQKEAR